MKKPFNKERSPHHLKMKLSALFIFVVFFTLQANTSYSQKTKISLNLNDVSISQLIDEVENKTEFRFVYKLKDVDLERKVSVRAKKESITTFLDKVFLNTATVYSIVDRQVFLTKKRENKNHERVIDIPKPEDQSIQSWTVSGIVTDSYDQPMPGASIVEKGTTNGTQTDFDGNFSLSVADENAVLVISYIGFVTQEIPVEGQPSLNISLQEDIASLEEVVLVGYGTQRKALVTGANVQVDGDDLVKMNTVNALQALQGQSPGVQITSTSGQPGESLKVTIRGLGSTAGSNPIYVVDGIITGDISYLNNSDIESISVLKDAASAAIYGSQASNGVILVSTKKGKKGKAAQITFDQYYGLQSVPRKVDLLNASEYGIMLNEAALNSGKNAYFTNAEIAALGKGTNWMDNMFVDNTAIKNYSFGASGGSESSVYSASLSYLGQEGIVGGKDLSNYERYNFRFNSEHKLYNDIVTIGENLSFAYINKNGIGVGNQYNNSLRSAFQVTPLLPMYDSDGNYFNTTDSNEVWLTGVANPFASMVFNNQNESNNQKLLGNVYLQIQPIKNLTFKTTLGLDYYASEGHSYSPIYQLSVYSFNTFDSASQDASKGKSLTWDNLLTYKFDLNENHHFETMVGTSSINYDGTRLRANNSDVVINNLSHAWIDNTTNSDSSKLGLEGSKSESKRMSYFSRLNYNFRDTYLLNATFRADGSSNFHPDNQWGYFPSVSAGWIITNNGFLSDLENLNFFKLRASWGQVGNQNAASFQFLSPIKTSNTNYIFGEEEGLLTSGAYPNRLSNLDLKWETSEQINLGFDARFFRNTLSVYFDWYEKTNKDWLIIAPILATAGADAPYINGGNVVNKGLELALQYQNSIGDFNFSIAANGAYNENEVGEIPTADGIIHGLSNQLWSNSPEFYRAQDGFPLGYFWGYKTAGVFQNQNEVNNSAQTNSAPGDIIYEDVNNDGEITEADKTMIGDPNPDFNFGFSVSGNYKAFDFSVSANGVAGNQIVQSYRDQSGAYGNYTTAIFDRWHGEGSSNTTPRVTEDNRNFTEFSDYYVHDGDFLRLNNITIGFDLAKLKLKKSFFASQFRVYASVLNLYTFTKYSGMDPEIGFGSSDDDQSFSSGVDVGYYPRPRTFMMGLNVKL